MLIAATDIYFKSKTMMIVQYQASLLVFDQY